MKNKIFLIIFVLFLGNIFCWREIFLYDKIAGVYFLKVGQGDSELIKLPKEVLILIDSGPKNNLAKKELSKILPFWKKRIDVFILSHPDFDHFGGLSNLISSYKIGAFLWNGDFPKNENLKNNFLEILEKLKKEKTKIIIVKKGDKILYTNYFGEILWPQAPKKFSNSNDNSIVFKFNSLRKKFLFCGDINKPAQKVLINLYGKGLKSEVLKFPHHGSKNAFLISFLKNVSPKIVVFEVGKNNRYLFPSKIVLEYLKFYPIKIFRTDFDNTIKITL